MSEARQAVGVLCSAGASPSVRLSCVLLVPLVALLLLLLAWTVTHRICAIRAHRPPAVVSKRGGRVRECECISVHPQEDGLNRPSGAALCAPCRPSAPPAHWIYGGGAVSRHGLCCALCIRLQRRAGGGAGRRLPPAGPPDRPGQRQSSSAKAERPRSRPWVALGCLGLLWATLGLGVPRLTVEHLSTAGRGEESSWT